MARRSPVTLGLALALICVISYGQGDDTCRTGCRGASHTFKYQEGTTYKYNFDSKILVSLSSAEGQQTTTEVKATVLLTQQPQCNQILRLQNVQVLGSNGKKYTNIPDVDKPIRINFHDGHLEDSICSTPGDTQNSLNLKRAIASIFQANLKSGHETDVFGLCPTEVTQHKEGNVLIVQKSRNLNRCAYRESIKQDFFATAFNLNSEIKSSPILNGDYEAKLRVKNGLLEQATIRESYLYVPFSVGSNGAKASIDTTLKYIGTAKDNSQVKVSLPKSIIFEDPHPVNSPHANVNNILAAVKEVTKTIDITVGENTAKEFTNLVKILRVSKKDDLLAVYNQVRAGVGFPDKTIAKKIFLDAILRAGNGDNIEVAIELLKNKELSSTEQNLVYLGLSTIRHATENSLNTAVNLLNQPNLPRSAYLGIGNLAGRFCQQHSCENVDAINKLTQKLIQKLGNGKASNRQEENDIVFVLKALSNIHHLNDNILAKITAIAQDKKAANRLRVTALETYLADPCKDKLRDSALTILKDIQQDSEVRIKAYLALAKCPNSKVGNAVKALLETEPSYQVGGFIVSHIRNLRASANPDKELAKQHLGLINVPKRFPIDLRKWSANGEVSYTIDSLGLANSMETNIIYSQNSFLPRSTSLNLTAEVFGHNFNFLEIETRQENLDRLVEQYLGPKGLLRSKSLQELWDSKGKKAKEFLEELKERVRAKLRLRRDVTKGEIDHINKQVQIKTNELNSDLDIDLSFKAFGSELLFLNINDDVQKYTPEALLDKIVDGFNQGLDKLKNFDENLRANLLFLDAEFAYPTSSGFPLRLGVEGTSNLQVKASGAIDVRGLSKSDSTIKLALIPSANIEVAGRLTIDTLVVESGLKTISTLHTATGGDLIVQLTPQSVDVKFSLPVEKQNLVLATHDIVFHTREWGSAESNQPLKFAQNKDFSICLDQLNDFIGLTFCGEFTGPNLQGQKIPILPFPFSGDAKVAITIEREDLSHYHLKDIAYTSNNKFGGEFLLEAVGKSGQKKISFAVDAFLYPEKFIKASITSPITSASLEGRIIDTPQEKSISLRLLQDKNEYVGKIGVGIQGSSDKAVYQPIIQYKTPQESGLQIPAFRVEGKVISEQKSPAEQTFTFDNVRVVIPNQKTISVNGKIGTEPETLFSDVTVGDGANTATFKGKLRVNPNLVKYNAELKNSVNPSGNFQLKGELTKSTDELRNYFQLAHGGDFSDKNNLFKVENSLKYRNTGRKDFLLETKNKLSYPLFNTNLQLDLGVNPHGVQYEVNVQYTDIKLGSKLDLEHHLKLEGTNYKLDFALWGLNNQVSLKSKRQITGDQSQIENSLDVNGKRLEVNGKIKHHVKPQDIDVAVDLIVKLPSHNQPFNVVSGLRFNPSELDASHKVTSGGTVFVDVFLKANRAGNANGSVKVNLKGQLVVNGQIKASRGSGTGEIVVELPAAGRTTKLDSTFTINDPTYNIILNIYPIFNQDKTKKITLSTQSTLKPNHLDTKNFVDVFGDKLEVNVKGTHQGEFTNGKTIGELEITLPCQRYFAAKLNRDFRNTNNVMNGNSVASLDYRENKNQPGNKITLKAQIKDVKPEDNTFDVNYQLSIESASGQNLNIDLGAKRLSDSYEFNNKIYGSLLSSPIVSQVKGHCRNGDGAFQASSSYTPLGKVLVSGKHDLTGSAGKPLSGELNLDVATTSKTITNLKVALSGSVVKSDSTFIQGKSKVVANSPQGTIIDLGLEGEVRSSDKENRLKASITTGPKNLLSVDTGLNRVGGKGDKQIKGDVAVIYGENNKVKGDLQLVEVSPHEYKLTVNLDLPLENHKSNKLQVHTKCNEDKSHVQSEVILTSDGKSWTTNTDFVISETTPSVDIKFTCPEGKLRHLLVKITKFNDHQLAGQLKLVNQKSNFLLESTIDADFESIDDFHLKATANSPSLKIDKYVIEANNKPAKTGRRIQVTAKSGNKNILAGSTSYTAREEQGKLIVEGSGSFKVHDKTQSANFKYIRQNLNQAKNGETGIEISFDAGLGNKAIDAELKITNKQFRILQSYCEEKKQCAHVEVDVKTTDNQVNYFNQEIEVAVDLRKLGLSHEFGLKAVTTRKNYLLDHTVDIHIQSQDNSKYQYSLYLHPKEAGVSLTTPKRVVSLESNINYPPEVWKNGGKITGELVFYADKKNQPNQKSGLISFLDVSINGNTVNGEVRFTNPALKRPLVVGLQSKATDNSWEVSATADVFAQPDQKVIGSYKYVWSDLTNWREFKSEETAVVKSSGLGFNIVYQEWAIYSLSQKIFKIGNKLTHQGRTKKYQSEFSLETNPKTLDVVMLVYNIPVYKLHSDLQLKDNQQIINSEISYYGHKPITTHLELKNYNTLKYTAAWKDKPQDKLQVNAALIPGEIADLRAEIIKGGSTQELGYITVKLDDAKFLKSDYNVNSKNINELLIQKVKSLAQEEAKELQKLSDKVAKEVQEELQQLGEAAKQASPNLKPLGQYYTNELGKIKEEVLADKSIKEASEFLYNIVSAFLQLFEGTARNFNEIIESVVHNFQNAFGKIIETVQKDLVPNLKEVFDKFVHLVIEIVDTATNVVLTIGAKLAQIAEQYRPELQQLATVFGEVSSDIFKAALNVYEAIKSVVVDQWQQIYNEIKNLPIVAQLKEEYENFIKHGLPAPEGIAEGLKDLLNTIKDVAPSAELKELVQAISDYLTAILTNQKVNDKAAIDRIIKAAVASVKNVLGSLAGYDPTADLQNVKVSIPSSLWNRLPRLAAVKFSPVSYLLGDELTWSPNFLLSLVNKPRNWFAPFPLYGIVAQGQHIFTFDGKHLTFPGKCNYLLARDAVDGNFTVIGSYNNGLLSAISLNQGSDTITLKPHGQVLVNNAPAELPARKTHVAAYRTNEAIFLVSDYGVRIVCGPELLVCSVSASGFYHGKIRGLLGNGNNEPYDDFTLPNGKIVSSESEFGNSYKTQASCGAVETVSHHDHHSNQECDKLFSWESSLRYCYPFVPVDNFKMACAHGLQAGVKDTQWAISVAYVAACNQHGIPVRVPSEFVKCENGEKPVMVGDKFTVETPRKAADIVVLVDTVKDNENTYKDYVQPLIQQLTTELSSKGVNDIEFHLIAYGGENQWPSHITTGGGKTTFKGKAPNLKFSENPPEDSLVTGCPQLDGIIRMIQDLKEDVDLALGLNLQALTYNEGLQYPFRANAIKSIIAVTGKPCEVGRLYVLQVLRTLLYRSNNINLNLITPISRDGAKAEAKNIVGFNSEKVWALGATKNKIKSFTDLGKELTYHDYCIDFTVQNDGNVFVSDHIHLQPKGQRKQFVQVTSHGIVEQLTSTEKQYSCECKYDSPYSAVNVCKLTASTDKPQARKMLATKAK